MHSILLAFAATGLATVAHAFTQPGASTWGPLLTPDLSHSVTQGENFEVTWDPESHPTDGVTVSLVLCHGPSTNCVTADAAIAEGIPASQKSFEWSVPSDLAPGTQNTDTGYGMLIIVDGTGEFQYSTQFSVLASKGSSGSSSSTSSSSAKPTATSTNSAGSIVLGPPAQQTGSYTWGETSTATGNGTALHPTQSGSWGSTTATGPAPTGTDSYTWTYVSTLSGSTLTSVLVAPTTTVAATGVSGSTASASASGVTASTFPGAADRLSLNAAGLAAAGVVALFAL